MAEFWGWCSSCARWFYASSAAGGSQPPDIACPVCLQPPLRVEVREYGPAVRGADGARPL